MALDATVGGAAANSYVTVAEGTAYYATHLYAAVWATLTTEQKEAALISATRVLDANQCFTGVPASETQALQWPRAGMFNRNGVAIPENVIPTELKYAVFELALNLATRNTTVLTDIQAQGLIKLKAGPVELGWATASNAEFTAIGPNVTAFLVPTWLCDDDIEDETNGLIFEVD